MSFTMDILVRQHSAPVNQTTLDSQEIQIRYKYGSQESNALDAGYLFHTNPLTTHF